MDIIFTSSSEIQRISTQVIPTVQAKCCVWFRAHFHQEPRHIPETVGNQRCMILFFIHCKDVILKFQSNQSVCLDVQSNFAYIAVTYTLLCKFNYGHQTFSLIFYMEHFSAVKIFHGLWEKYELFLLYQTSKCLKKSFKKSSGLLLRPPFHAL